MIHTHLWSKGTTEVKVSIKDYKVLLVDYTLSMEIGMFVI